MMNPKLDKPELLDSTDMMKLCADFQPGFPFSNVCKIKAQECLKEKNFREAASNLSEAHFPRLRQQFIQKAYYPFLRDKSTGRLSSDKVSERHKSFLDVMEKGFTSIEDVTTMLPPSWVVIQITSKASLMPEKKRSDVPGLWLSRLTREDPVLVVDVKENPDLKIISQVQEVVLNNRRNQKINREFLHLYWKTRDDYNFEMKGVVENMEKQWIKHAKTYFVGITSEHMQHSKDILSKHGVAVNDQQQTKLACLLSSLKSLSKSEVAETLCSISGESVEEISKKSGLLRDVTKYKGKKTEVSPVILVLDHDLTRLPWENMPFLKDTPVTRVPSLRFLKALLQQKKQKTNEISNPFYIINPQSDLPQSEKRIKGYLKDKEKWDGITGRPPTAKEFSDVICNNDLLLYCGHGSGTQYYPKERIQQLDCQAIPLLMGCSSANLNRLGEMVEPFGVTSSYILAGCSNLVGYLWEITDKQCDTMTMVLLDNWLAEKEEKRKSVVEAVVEARKSVEMFADAAALVVYGLP